MIKIKIVIGKKNKKPKKHKNKINKINRNKVEYQKRELSHFNF